MLLAVIITSIVILIALMFYLKSLEKKKYHANSYLFHLQKAMEFMAVVNNFNDYITWVERDRIKSKYDETGRFFLNKAKFYKKEVTVKKFNEVFQNFDGFIAAYNKYYVRNVKETLKDFFENIEGKKLDDQQQTAVATDEYSNLIIAGAGSGKTLTILGKVKYLIEKKNIDP